MPTIRVDSREVRYLSERDWRLAHLIARIGDLDCYRSDSAFHNIAHSIVEQMLSMKAAARIEGRLLELCGGELTPERVVACSVDEIKACGISMHKAKSLHGFAEYACEHDVERFAVMPEEDVRRELMALPGIGIWTVDMFLLFYLGYPDILPVEDGAVRQAFLWLYGASITSPEVQEVICSLWHPYASTAVRYLYRALNCGLVKELNPSSLLWEAGEKDTSA